MDAPRRVLYVVSRFPAMTTTFTANEMAAIAAEGVDIFVAPVWKSPAGYTPHGVEKPFLSKIVPLRWGDPRFWCGALRGLLRRPQVIGVIARLFPGHFKSIYLPFKLMAAIPKGLYLGQWCVENQIEHIHAHFLTSPTTAALIAAAVAGVPYSYTAHAFDITSKHPKSVNGSIPLKCRRAALGVTISNYNREYMMARWPTIPRPEVIYNGIDPALFAAAPERPDHTAGDPWRILCVSRLEPKKGHDVLIRAVARLRQNGIDARLDIFGDGGLKPSLQDLINSLGQQAAIQLRGPISQEAVAEEYRRADIFALASVPLAWGDADGLPTVLIEALAAELPTISTQVTGIPEIIRDGDTGRCVPPNDVEAFADGLVWLMEHPTEVRAMGQKGRELVLECFDRRTNAGHLLALWRDLHKG